MTDQPRAPGFFTDRPLRMRWLRSAIVSRCVHSCSDSCRWHQGGAGEQSYEVAAPGANTFLQQQLPGG